MDISTITSISIDLAGRSSTFERQKETSNLILFFLDKGYQIFLFSSNQKEGLEKENFQHPRVTFLNGMLSPESPEFKAHLGLTTPETFWVTDNVILQSWLAGNGRKFAYSSGSGSFGQQGVKIGSIGDLAALFDSTKRVIDQVATAVDKGFRTKGRAPYLIGVGGPPLSGYQQFAVNLRRKLEDMGHSLVDLLDLSSVLAGSDSLGIEPDTWRSAAVGEWVLHELLAPLQAGKRVFVESLPEGVPDDFEAHIPLFLSEESLIVVLGATLFSPPVKALLDFSILFEVSAKETARRLYEIPESQEFDQRFVTQYLDREGRTYKSYLQNHAVADSVEARVDAERSEALNLAYLA